VFEVLLEGRAERDLKRLERDTLRRMYEALRTLAENPYPTGCCKLAGSASDWRIRVGDYRIIYEVDKAARAVRVMRIRHRREVYR
jgi:mRNA interferase RelE/StbE